MDEFFKANQSTWDKRAEHHIDSDFYDVKGFLEGNTSLKTIERSALGDVSGKTMLHLMCHFGQDTLSWTRMGAKATGIDISNEAIKNARSLNDQLGLDARFIQSNIYDISEHLNDEQFDIIFASYGVLGWLPDLNQYAHLVAKHLKSGGIYYIAEFHPTLYIFDFDSVKVEYDYFNTGKPFKEVETTTYTGQEFEEARVSYWWSHSLEEIIGAFLKAGLQVVEYKEYDYSPYNCFPNMKQRADGEYIFGNFGVSFPHVFGLKVMAPEK
jgi:2-polyprenyl-3-methyl-5-hydroxy-6-metoxy-1,4-benzoquinol methylase